MRLFILIFCLGILLFSGCDSDSNLDSSFSPTTVVGPTKTLEVPAMYATIQRAIKAARSGDFVRVASGVYRENLQIKGKDISLRGAGIGQTILIGTLNIAETSETSVEGLTIKGGGIHARKSSVRISGNEILENPGVGLWIERCQNVVISGNIVSNNTTEGIVFDTSSGVIGSSVVTQNLADGIALNNSSPTLLDNEVTANGRDGIAIRGFTSYAAPILLQNLVRNNGGISNYDIICFGGNTNPTGVGNIFERCLNCSECQALAAPVTYRE
ncbi:MAG: pectinesterase family protein [Candidatus Vecturithrix sp.]|jgi:parallel beta-helix repeat protein|nr:pectinesterase family protein [Candidatus Vecturithrix sp.]